MGQSGVVIVREQQPLATGRESRPQPLPQRAGADLPLEVSLGEAPDDAHQRRRLAEAEDEQLQEPVDPGPVQALQEGEATVAAAAACRDRPVGVGKDPGRRPLEDVEARHAGLDEGDDLDRAGAGADDRHPQAVEGPAVLPGGGVEARSLEPLQAGQGGLGRLGQRPRRRHQRVRREAALGGVQHPAARALVPASLFDAVLEADALADAEVARHPLHVLEDLGLGRVQP